MSLKDKAKRIDFTAMSTQPTVSNADARPKTAPGAMMAFAADQRSDLLIENESLRTQASKVDELEVRLRDSERELASWDGAKATRLIDPARIHRSEYANRHELNFGGAEFEQLKAEIANAGGNVQPIKVRPIASTDGVPNYEIVFGHRRHEACRQLGLPVSAMVDNLDDKALFVEMERENRARKDLSGWEQGVMYQRALDMGLFPSNRKLADAIGVDLGNLGRALSLARLPAEVVGAFNSPLDLQFRWAKPLSESHESDPAGLVGRAIALKASAQVLTAREIFEALLGKGEGVVPYNPPADIVLKHQRKQAAVVSVDAKGRTLVRFEATLGDQKRRDLAKLIQNFLET